MRSSYDISSLSQEIMLRICQHIADHPHPDDINCRDLLSVALTCRSLSEPALDILWHTLPSISPLLCTLPEDLCAIVPFVYTHVAVEATQLIILRAPAARDFARFFAYSARVMVIGQLADSKDPEMVIFPGRSGYSCHHVPSATWDLLLAFAPKPLLPNLQILAHEEWYPQQYLADCETPFHSAKLLLSSKLKTVELCCFDPHRSPAHATDLVRSLSRVAASLRDLTIVVVSQSYSMEMKITGKLFGPEVGLFRHLARYNGIYVCVSPVALLALGHLPCLREIHLRVDPGEYLWDALPQGRHAVFFPALEELSTYGISWEWCAAFLRALSTISLRRLSFFCEEDPLPDPILLEALCIAICDLPSARSIDRLTLRIYCGCFDPQGQDLAPQCYRAQYIAPLFNLPAIRYLHIQGRCNIIADDLALEAAGRSWPDIEHLYLDWYDLDDGLDGGIPQVTLAGLLALARGCIHLDDLSLAVDMRTLPGSTTHIAFDGLPAPPVAPHGLRHFAMGGSMIRNNSVAVAASFLSLVFPRLSSIECSYDDPGAWRDLLAMYHCFVEARRQERAWAVKNGRRLSDAGLNA